MGVSKTNGREGKMTNLHNRGAAEKSYTYRGYRFYVANNGMYDSIFIENPDYDDTEFVDELPAELIRFSSVRHAIYNAYVNLGDMWIGTICRMLQSDAPLKQLMAIENIMNKYNMSIWHY